jgi:hypothetical protein
MVVIVLVAGECSTIFFGSAPPLTDLLQHIRTAVGDMLITLKPKSVLVHKDCDYDLDLHYEISCISSPPMTDRPIPYHTMLHEMLLAATKLEVSAFQKCNKFAIAKPCNHFANLSNEKSEFKPPPQATTSCFQKRKKKRLSYTIQIYLCRVRKMELLSCH